MATYRYWDIRRDIYEQCSNKALRKYRTFADMRKLFKLSYWLLLIGMLVCLIAYIALFFFLPGTFYWLIPVGGTLMLSIIGELFGSRMYNPLERKRELEEHSANLEVYIDTFQITNWRAARPLHIVIAKLASGKADWHFLCVCQKESSIGVCHTHAILSRHFLHCMMRTELAG